MEIIIDQSERINFNAAIWQKIERVNLWETALGFSNDRQWKTTLGFFVTLNINGEICNEETLENAVPRRFTP